MKLAPRERKARAVYLLRHWHGDVRRVAAATGYAASYVDSIRRAHGITRPDGRKRRA